MFNPQDLNSLLKYCQTLNQDKDDAYDLLYSSIEKYLRKPPKCDAAKFGYIRKIIKNQWIDGLRRFEPDLESITPENQECIGYLINDGNPVEKQLIQQTTLAIVWQSLSFKEKLIIYKWVIDRRTIDEIAEAIQCPRNTIISKIYRMRKRVQKQFHDLNAFD